MNLPVPLAAAPATAAVPTPERAGIGWGLTLMLMVTASLLGIAGGVGAAYYFVLTTPVPPSVVVVDTDALLREALSANPSNPKQAADEVLAVTQQRVAQLVASGIVVLDRSAVIDAPASRIVRADLARPAEGEAAVPVRSWQAKLYGALAGLGSQAP